MSRVAARGAGLVLALLCLTFASACAGRSDGGGFGGNPALEKQLGLTPWADKGRSLDDSLAQSSAILENAMLNATDLGVADPNPNATTVGRITVVWQPGGLRETAMPPNPRAPRVYLVRVDLERYLQQGDVVAVISFSEPNPRSSPSVGYAYTLEKTAGEALVELFYSGWPMGGKPVAPSTSAGG